jgi:hypothetical protein
MADAARDTILQRRGFLRGLATLPLIGGGVALLGNPTKAAEPVTDGLLRTYSTWLELERRYLHAEMDPRNERNLGAFIDMRNPAAMYHFVEFSEADRDRERPSTRAAIVLAAIGCNWKTV